MANSKLTALTQNTAPLSTDIAYMVDDPAGSPLSQKVTFDDMGKALNSSNIPNTPAGGISATNVQGAINELDTEKAALSGAAFTGATTVSTSGATDALDLTQSGSGVVLNVKNAGTGNLIEVDGTAFVVPSTGDISTDRVINSSAGYTGTINTASQPNITSVGTLTSATISGDLTVDTTTLKVDSTNNFVGIGTASPADCLHVESTENQLARFISTNGNGRIRISDASDDLFVGTASGVAFFGPETSATGNNIQMDLSNGNTTIVGTLAAGAISATGQISSGTVSTGSITATDVNSVPLTNTWGWTNFLADDGTYKAVGWGWGGWESTQSTVTAWEDITAWDAIVYQETSSAYNIWDFTFSWNAFDVSAQDWVPTWMAWNNDWSKLFMTWYNDNVYEYAASTAYNIETLSFTTSFSVVSEVANPIDVYFNGNWETMIVLWANAIYEYDLTTWFDVTTASYSWNTFSTSTQSTWNRWFIFNSAWTKMILASITWGSNLFQYTLSTGFDVSTISYDSVSLAITEDTSIGWISQNATWSSIYLIWNINEIFIEYWLTTPYDLTTGTFSDSSSTQSWGVTNVSWGLLVNPNWEKVLISDNTSDFITEFSFWKALTAGYFIWNWSHYKTSNFVWFASETVTSWNPFKLDTSWVNSNQTWLSIWKEYWLWENWLSLTALRSRIKVWKAISSTEIEIFPSWINEELNLIYPHDLSKWIERISINPSLIASGYNIPNNKTLYLQWWAQTSSVSSSILQIDWVPIAKSFEWPSAWDDWYINFAQPVIIDWWSVLTTDITNTNPYAWWILVDKDVNITAITHSDTAYTVPDWKSLVILQAYSGSGDRVEVRTKPWNVTKRISEASINNATIDISMNVLHNPIVYQQKDILNPSNRTISFNGYLVDKLF